MTKASETKQKKLREKAQELTSKEVMDTVFGKHARRKLEKAANPEEQSRSVDN